MTERFDPQHGKACKVTASLPGGEHQRNPFGKQSSSNKPERLSGCTVEPLCVVDHAEERLPLGGFREQAENRQADEERARCCAAAQAERDAERLALWFRELIGEVEDRRTQLLQRRVVELHLPLDTGGSNDQEVLAGLDGALEQRGLADAGVSADDEDGAVFVARGVQQPLEHRPLALPADQPRGVDSHGHPGSMPASVMTTDFRDSIAGRGEHDSGMSDTAADTLPDYAPVPKSALGPALNEQGYYVGRVERNLYWVTDGVYQSAFLTTSDGVVLLDAPPTIGNNIKRAVDEIASANGVSNKITHLIYSHHHADHAGASSLFDKNVTRIGHEETRRLLLRDDDPARPPNEETFQDTRTLEIGGERIDLAWHGANHSPDNIIIHLPDHDTLMLIDIVNPGWAPVYIANLTEDIPGYIEAPANALAYSWKHFIGGHLGRLGTRDDVTVHQQYMADIAESSRKAIDTVDPTRYFVKYGENMWAAVKGYLDEVTAVAAAPVIEKYTGVLAAADVFTESTTFWVMESIRLDLGYGSQVHP